MTGGDLLRAGLTWFAAGAAICGAWSLYTLIVRLHLCPYRTQHCDGWQCPLCQKDHLG